MKQFTKIMLVGLGFGLLGVILGSLFNHSTAQAQGTLPPLPPIAVTVTNTASNPAVAQDVSGVASQLVEITCIFVGSPFPTQPCLDNLNSAAVFTVPAGKSFVITSVEFTPTTPGGGVSTVLLSRFDPTTGVSFVRELWEVSNAQTTQLLFPGSGIVFRSGSELAVQAPNSLHVVLRGYLTSI